MTANLLPAKPPPGQGRTGLTIGLLMVITFAAFEALAVATVLPDVRDDLHGTALYGWSFSAFLLTSIVGLVWAGELADRRGPALPFTLGLSLFGIGLLVAGTAPVMGLVVAGRGFQGFGAGAIPTVAYVTIGRAFPEETRPRMFAYMSSAWVVPGLVGPAAAAAIAEWTSWRVVFLGLVGPLALVVPLVLPALRRLGPPANPPPAPASRVPWAILLATTAGIVLAGVSLLADGRLVGIPVAVAGASASVPALRRLLPRGTVRLKPGLPSLVVANTFLNLSFFCAEAFIPLAMADLRGQPPLLAGLALTTASVTWTSGTWLVERRTPWRNPARAVPVGVAFIASGIAVAGAAMVEPVPVAVLPVGWAIAGFGIGLAYPNLSLGLLRVAPAAEQGAATASMKIGEYLGPAVGTGVAGALIAVGTDRGWEGTAIGWVFAGAAAAGLVAAAAAVRSVGGRPGPASAGHGAPSREISFESR